MDLSGDMLMNNKLAVLRGSNLRGGCPFGLSISISCKSVGTSIHDMQVLQGLPEEEREAAKKNNRHIYTREADGTGCPFLEGVVAAAKEDVVNCDFSDSGAGERSYPFRGSPVYPRVFNGFQSDRNYSTQLGDYSSGESNDYGRGQLSDGVFQAIYSSREGLPLIKEAGEDYLIDGLFGGEETASGDLTISPNQLIKNHSTN